jgi:hypothetical protein
VPLYPYISFLKLLKNFDDIRYGNVYNDSFWKNYSDFVHISHIQQVWRQPPPHPSTHLNKLTHYVFTWLDRKRARPFCLNRCSQKKKRTSVQRRVHITRARAGARQACARRKTRLAFTCARKSSSTLLQLLARLRRVRIRIFTRSVYRL